MNIRVRMGICIAVLASTITTAPLDVRGQYPVEDPAGAAARAFADRLAPRSTEANTRAFQLALDLAIRLSQPTLPVPGRSARIDNRGDIHSDPRYVQSIDAMAGGPTPKIWRGQHVRRGDFPDTVAILSPGGLSAGICTGTLITPDTVITAAHCHCLGIRDHVVFGEDVSKPVQRIKVARSVPRIQCTAPLSAGDIALMFLEKPVQIAPRRIADSASIDSVKELLAIGFGRTEDPGAEPMGIKRMVELPVASSACAGQVPTANGPMEDSVYYQCNRGTELVAGLQRLDRDTCNGDSGGPVLVTSTDGSQMLAGVTSRAVRRPGFAECGDGGIYARVDGDARKWMFAQGAKVSLEETPFPAGLIVTARSAEPKFEPARTVSPLTAGQVNALFNLPGSKDIIGVLNLRSDGSVMLTSRDLGSKGEAVALPVTNPGVVTTIAANSTAKILVRKMNEGVSVESVSLVRAANLESAAASLAKDGKFSGLASSLSDLAKTTNAAAAPGAEARPEDTAKVIEDTRLTEIQIVELFLKLAPEQKQQRAALIKAFRGVKAQLKATYGHDDRYRPYVYEEIFKTSRGAAAISRASGTQYFCSGALIGNDLILTARHCLAQYSPDELEVTFNWEFDLANLPLQRDVYRVVELLNKTGSGNLDYAILRVAPKADGALPSKSWPKQCLDMHRVVRGDPLYVVGHPEGSARLVADNATVYFPYRVTEIEYGRLLLILESEFEGSHDRAERMQEFIGSYQKIATASGDVEYRNFSKRFGGSPTIGANTDTFQGNSGSPVYRRIGSRIIGIIYAGEPDLSAPFNPGWRRHEAILPIREIVDDMKSLKPNWIADHGVCIAP